MSALRPILVTGADGFVGQRLTAALRAEFPATPVIGTSHTDREGLHTLEIRAPEKVRDLIAAVRPRACIHLAALSSVDEAFADPIATYETNLFGTLHLAHALRDLCPEALLIYASTGEVYGTSFVTRTPLSETSLLAPANPYAAAKAAADLALGQMALSGLRALTLRLFNHTGPGQSSRFVLPRMAEQMAAIKAGHKPPRLETGSLDRWRDFLDVSDVVQAYIAILRHEDPPNGQAFNIASGTPRHLRKVARELAALSGVEVEFVEHATTPRPFDSIYSSGDPSRFADTFDWRPAVPWKGLLTSLLDYWAGQEARMRS
ncbi:GDP-4-dehydro-6-deoxy-D-mannose reductase [Arboricoccus pini]|uniref:GDP-4-dehydro-6-deoxy-D-mannose reductase n=1 Tax=Arboricoccus pini TaxID=1963835 RepID=A0A212RD70_9PROT|nr:GDP-mannose 4,6-dehydratase [Arboricoccus pini]SNB70247.1 GDP-4-dehydro-6-deoxy-D-mannose reductase [Arboricoccus pini]